VQAAYSRERYKKRMAKVIAHLGGSCVVCGAIDGLQTHHIDPQAKEFTISTFHSWPWAVLLKSLRNVNCGASSIIRKYMLPSTAQHPAIAITDVDVSLVESLGTRPAESGKKDYLDRLSA